MNNTIDTTFVNDYEPKEDALVELFNGRFVDVVSGDYFNEAVRLLLRGGKIEAMPGLEGQLSEVKPDFVIDLKGKTVMPGLINTHCHATQTMPSLLPDIKDIKLFKAHAEKQIEKNLAECLIHGITNIRDAWAADLRKARLLKKKYKIK
ncbi:MAG: amidohydrolase family protein, partial [Desulfobacterales bacterium]|nr:amidohydrolase family protein [Desulfobacterales bacterium]